MSPTPAEVRWSRRVEAQARSGQTIKAWCEARDLNPRTLSWWRWKLRQREDPAPASSPFVELVVADPLPTSRPDDCRGLQLTLPGSGVIVDVEAATDLDLLRRVVEALC